MKIFTYHTIKDKKVTVKQDIRDFVWKENLKRLRKGKSTFLTNSLTIK